MGEQRRNFPLDARLLGETITDLNISRRNVAIYPRGHPAVERSLNRAAESFQKLLRLRPEIVLAIAKDSLIFDDFTFDRKNPVYREFALTLSRMSVVTVTFLTGLTRDELYDFDMLLTESSRAPSSYSALRPEEGGGKFPHIKIGLMDFGAFSFTEGQAQEAGAGEHLWERYVYGLLEGTLQTDEALEAINEVPPGDISRVLNSAPPESLSGEAGDRVVNAFMGKPPGKAFPARGIRRLLEIVNGLKPQLKEAFLASAVKTLSDDIPAAEKVMEEISPDRALELLKVINEQRLVLPKQLEDLFEKFSRLHQEGVGDRFSHGKIILDDIVLSPDVGPMERDRGGPPQNEEYENEIRALLRSNVAAATAAELQELKAECSDEHIEKEFNETILEFLLPESTSEEDYEYFLSLLKEQSEHFLWTGQYGEVQRIMCVLDAEKRFGEKTAAALRYYRSAEFVSRLMASLRIMGRQKREEAVALCDYYGGEIIAPLIQALIEEETQAVRRFFLNLIIHYGERAVPEAVKHLGDGRWFVKRNMLFILGECGGAETRGDVHPYCRHENLKVSTEAIKCLLKAGDSRGVGALKEHLKAEGRESVEQAVALSGSFRVREVVPDLVNLLRKREMSSLDFHEKIPVVRALGQIGDPAALVALKDLLAARSILFKAAVEKLREEIFGSLKHYPPDDIRGLVEEGIKSKNERIRTAALRLKERR